MELVEDTRQQIHDGDKHAVKHEWWAAHGIEVVRRKLDFGDYSVDGSNIFVDTKQSIDELASNLGRGHDRFRREIARANAAGCLLVVLVETTEATCLDDVMEWVNGHCRHCNKFYSRACKPFDQKSVCLRHGTKKPLQGPTLHQQMDTMQKTRCVRFEFTKPEASARRICELLGVKYETGDQNQVVS